MGRLVVAVLVGGCFGLKDPPAGMDATTVDAALDARVDPVSCGTVGLFSDRFDPGTVGQGWVVREGDLENVTRDGMLAVTVKPLAVGRTRVSTERVLDLRGSAVSLEVVSWPSGELEADVGLMGLGSAIEFHYDGEVVGRVRDGNRLEETFRSAALPRYLRFSEAGGVVSWETSPDGTGWAVMGTAATPEFARAVGVSVGVEALAVGTGVPGALAIDNLSGAGGRWCAASEVSDDFEVEDALTWQRRSPCVRFEGGRVVLESLAGVCELIAPQGYDLRESSIVIDVVEPSVADGETVELFFEGDPGTVRMALSNNSVVGTVGNGFSLLTLDVAPYRPVWRIRQSAGELIFEVSPDGVVWMGASTPLEIDVSLGDLGVRIGGDLPGGRALFDDLNPPP